MEDFVTSTDNDEPEEPKESELYQEQVTAKENVPPVKAPKRKRKMVKVCI